MTAVLNCAFVPVIHTILVWSQVFVPLDVPENVPLCVASVQSQRFVRAVLAFDKSERLLFKSRQSAKFEFSDARNVAQVSPLLSVIILSLDNVVNNDVWLEVVVCSSSSCFSYDILASIHLRLVCRINSCSKLQRCLCCTSCVHKGIMTMRWHFCCCKRMRFCSSCLCKSIKFSLSNISSNRYSSL